ncbi:MAG: hypothetical protein NTX64_10130, partial [Elusimicrobia bacterium]|nr:hypothetical protein [Elusimicrobiota bacterium]
MRPRAFTVLAAALLFAAPRAWALTATGFYTLNSSGAALSESQWNNIANVSAGLTVQDPAHGLAVSAQALAYTGDGHDFPGNTSGFGVLYSTDAGQSWIDRRTITAVNVAPSVKSLAVFRGKLWATDNLGNQIYSSADGLNWTSTTIDNSPSDGPSPGPLAVFNGTLYTTNANSDLYWTGDGVSWSWIGSFGPIPSMVPFGNQLTMADDPDGAIVNLRSPNNWWFTDSPGAVASLATFNGNLYAGDPSHAAIWKSADGVSWQNSAFPGGGVAAMTVYNNWLFAADATTGKVYVTYDGSYWLLTNGGGPVSSTIQAMTVFNGKLYAGDASGKLYVTADTNTWVAANGGAPIGASISGLASFNGMLYAADSVNGNVYQISPVAASMTGSDGTTAPQALIATLNLAVSTNSTTCNGLHGYPCGATNQVIFTFSDMAGNATDAGPFAILVSSAAAPAPIPLAISPPSYPANGAYVNVQPNFDWLGPSAAAIASLPAGSSFLLQVSNNDPTFWAGNLVINVATPVGTAGAYISTFTLTNNTVYYWRVATSNGVNLGPWSQTYRFATDFTPPVMSGNFTSAGQAGGSVLEAQSNPSTQGVSAQITIQDATSGLAVSTSALRFFGDGHDDPEYTSGYGVMYSTNAGHNWIDGTWSVTNAGAAVGNDISSFAEFNGKLYAGDMSSGIVYVSADGNSWSATNGGAGLGHVTSLATFNGKLYAGTYSPRFNQALIYVSADGNSWSATNGGAPVATSIFALAVFNGKLYAGDGLKCHVYVSADGNSWTATNGGASISGGDCSIEALVAFNGKLYAGDFDGGIYMSADGNSWSETNGGVSVGNISPLVAFNGKLYAGDEVDGRIYVSANGNSWTTTNGGAPVGVGIITLLVFNGKLYAGDDHSSKIYVSVDGNSWSAANGGVPVGSSINGFAGFNGKLYAGDFGTGKVFQLTPATATLSGADGTTAAQTLAASGLNLAVSTSAAVCGGVSPCKATNQVIFTATDLAGNVSKFGPYAVLVGTASLPPPPTIVETLTYPPNGARVNVQPNFNWTGPASTLNTGWPAGNSFLLQVSKNDPNFAPGNIAINVSIPAPTNSNSAPVDGTYMSTYTLSDNAVYYWRVATTNGSLGPWSGTFSFTTDFSAPTASGAFTIGAGLSESQVTSLSTGVTVQMAIRDVTSGLAVSQGALAVGGDGHDGPATTSGFGVLYSTNAGQTWIDFSNVTTSNGGSALGSSSLGGLAVYNGRLYATDSGGAKVYSSADGLNWSGSSLGTKPGPMAVYQGWLWVGDAGRAYQTTNGSSWYWDNINLSPSAGCKTMATFQDQLSIVDSYAGGYILSLRPAFGVWFNQGFPPATAFASFNGNLYAGDSNGRVYQGLNGLHWNASYSGGTWHGGALVGTNIGALAVYNGKLYAGDAGNGRIYTSPDGINWSTTNRASAVSAGGVQALAVFNGKLYAGDSKGKLFVTADGSNWTSPNGGAAVGSSIVGLAAFNGKLYAADGSTGKVYQLTPLSATLAGADGTTATQTISATGLTLALSTNTTTCLGLSPCGATNQVIFTASDLAGNVKTLGPFAIQVAPTPAAYTSSRAWTVARAPGGNLYAVGNASNAVTGNDIWLAKYDANANLLSSRTINGLRNGDDAALAVAVDGAGNVFAAGYVTAPGLSMQPWLGKFDSALNTISSVTVYAPVTAGQPGGYAAGVAISPANEVYVAGSMTDGSKILPWLAKFNNSLVLQSSATYFYGTTWGSWAGNAGAIALAPNGDIVVTGIEPHAMNTSSDIWLARFDSGFHVLNSILTHGPGADSDTGAAIAVDAAGTIYAAGSISVPGAVSDAWVAKYDGSLNLLASATLNGSANANDQYRGLALGNNGDVIVNGSVNSISGSSTLLFAEYSNSLVLLSSVTTPGLTQDTGLGVAVDTAAGAAYAVGALNNLAYFHKFPIAPAILPPTTPSGFAGTAQSVISILWTWTNNATNQTGFRVMSGATNLSGDLPASATSWLQTGLTVGWYYGPYFVRAFNAGGTADSNWASASALAGVSVALSSPTYPPNGAYVNVQPNFDWLGLGVAGLGAGASFSLQVSKNDPAFGPSNIVISISTPAVVNTSISTATWAYVSTFTLINNATYYWRVSDFDYLGNRSPYSQTYSFVTDFTPPVQSGAFSIGAGLSESQVSALAAGVTVQIAIQDATSGLAVSTSALRFFGDGRDDPEYASGYGVMYSTNAGQTWIDASAITATNGGAALGLHMQSLAGFNGKLYAGTGSGMISASADGSAWGVMNGGNAAGISIWAMATFNGKLYAGDVTAGGVSVSANGNAWSSTSGLAGKQIASLAVFGGKLYAGGYNDGKVYVTSDGSAWTATNGGVPVAQMIGALAAFNGRLYAADRSNGKVYASADGNTWSATNSGAAVGPSVWTLATFSGKLYAADDHGKVYVSADGNAWSTTNGGAAVGSAIYALAAFNGKLYAGDWGNGKIYVSADGNAWTATNGGAAVGVMIFPLAGFNGKLYGGDWISGNFYQLTPVPATLSGADGTKSAQTLTATGLNFAPSTNSVTCGSVSPCAATNQVIFTASDMAGNATRFGPFAVQVAAPPSAPTAASGFSGTAQSPSSILWTWTNNATNQTGYRVMSGTTNVSGDLPAGATSWLQTGLSANRLYGPYVARAFNSGGTADSSSASRYTLANPPAGLAAGNIGLSSATLAWSPNGDPSGTAWDLERSTDGVNFGSISTASAVAGYVDTGLAPSTTYYYEVRARNGDGSYTAFNGPVAVLTATPAPAAPSGFAGTAQSASSIFWTWTNNAANQAGFRVMSGATNLSGDLPASATSWPQTGLSVNTLYGPYLVRAFNIGGTGDSAGASRYTLANSPSGLAATSIGLSSVTLTWSANGDPSWTIWDLQRSLNGSSFSSIYTSSAAARFTDAGLSPSTTYYYEVRAANGNTVFTAFNGPITVRTATQPPAAPSAFTAAAQSATSILWAWTNNATNQAGFRVMCGAANASGDLAASASSWLQTGLSANTLYGPCFVRAFNDGGAGDSASASRYTLAVTPSGLAATAVGASSATLAWSPNGNPAGTIWELQRSADGVAYSSVYSSSAAAGYTDMGLTPGSMYYYQAHARNAEWVATPFNGPITIYTAPAAVLTGLTVAGNALTAAASVTSRAGAVTLNFETSPSPSFASGVLSSGFIAASNFTFSALPVATAYYVRVTARDSLGNVGPPSAVLSAFTQANVYVSTGLPVAAPAIQGGRVPLLRLSLQTDPGATATWSSVKVRSIGTTLDSDVTAVEVYADASGRGVFDPAADQLLGSAPMAGGAAVIPLTLLVTPSPSPFFVVYRLSPVATPFATAGASIASAADIGVSSPFAPVGAFPAASNAASIQYAPNTLTFAAANVAPAKAAPGAAKLPVLKLTASADAGMSVLSALRLSLAGTLAAGQVAAVKLYRDLNGNGVLDASDALLTSGADRFANGVADMALTASQANRTIESAPVTLFVAVDLAAAAQPGSTFGVSVDTPSSIGLASTVDTVTFSGAPLASNQTLVMNTLTLTASPATPAQLTQGYPYALIQADVSVDYGQAQLTSVQVARTGSSTDADVDNVQLYRKAVLDGRPFDPSVDTLLGSGTFLNGSAAVAFPPLTVTAGAPMALFVVYSVSPSAVVGDTLGAVLAGAQGEASYTSLAANLPFTSPTGQVILAVNRLIAFGANVAPASLIQGTTNVALLRLQVRADRKTLSWAGVQLTRLGTGPDPDIRGVAVYKDSDGNGILGSGDALMTSGQDAFSGGRAALSFNAPELIDTNLHTYFVAVTLDPGAAPGDTVGVRLAGAGDLDVLWPNAASTGPPSFPFDAGPVPVTQYPNVVAVDAASVMVSSATPGTLDVALMKLTLRTNVSNASWLKLHVDRAGSSADADIGAVKLYYDANQLGVFYSTRTAQYQLVGATVLANGSADLLLASPVTLSTAAKTFFLALDLSTGALFGDMVGLSAASASYFTVNAPNAPAPVSFASGLVEVRHPPNIIEVGGADVAPPTAVQGTAAVPMISLRVHTETYTGRWSGLTVSRIGTASDTDTTRVSLYALPERIQTANATFGTLIATGAFVNGQAVLGFLASQTITTSTKTYFLAYDVAPLATSSATLGASLSGPDSFIIARPSSATASAVQSGLTRITGLTPGPIDRGQISNVSSYPNPVDSRVAPATIVYTLSASADTELQVVDAFGVKVRGMKFGAGSQGGKAGLNSVSWDGSDDSGR